jgi:glycosyltransferase involved in cell wall biosynthesis
MTGSGYDDEGGRRVVLPPSLTVVEEPLRPPAEQADLTVSVVICAYTEDRWPLLLRSVASVQDQSRSPVELIVCVDHNGSLLERCRQEWGDQLDNPAVPMVVLANKYQGRLGSARNSAAEVACGDIVAFLDDDAWADPDWLDRLLSPYGNESVVAVGGAPVPEFEGSRPGWFPFEFDWVFGCAYSGLPERQAPVARLIGANMSVRRLALAEIGGFHSDNHDDMDMCHRLLHLRPADQIVYEPMARVHHFVPVARTTWGYFWRRCFFVNKGKVAAFHQMEGAGNLSADIGFVGRALSRGVSKGLRQALRGDARGVARAASILAGIVLAGSGHVAGTWQLRRRQPGRPLGAGRRDPGRFPGTGAASTGAASSEDILDSPQTGEQYHKLSFGRQAWLQNR